MGEITVVVFQLIWRLQKRDTKFQTKFLMKAYSVAYTERKQTTIKYFLFIHNGQRTYKIGCSNSWNCSTYLYILQTNNYFTPPYIWRYCWRIVKIPFITWNRSYAAPEHSWAAIKAHYVRNDLNFSTGVLSFRFFRVSMLSGILSGFLFTV